MNRDSSSTFVLSEEARARARFADDKVKMVANRRNNRRLSIQGSLALILGDEKTDYFDVDDNIRSGSVSSQQGDNRSCQSSSRTTVVKYQRRGSVTKHSLDDTDNNKSTSILSAEARARARVADSKSKMGASRRNNRRLSIQGSIDCILGDEDTEDLDIDDGIRNFSSRQSGKSCQSSRTTRMRYQRRGSVTKYSVDASSAPDVDNTLADVALSITKADDDDRKNGRTYQDNGNISNVPTSSPTGSRGPSSSFADIAPQCTTIDSLPLPMKKKSSTKINRIGSKINAREPISKYSNHTAATEDDACESSSEMIKVEKSTTTSAANKQHIADDNHSPLRKTTKKKKKKELKLRKGQEQRTLTTPIDGTTKKRIKQKRRCSVTKYNLPQELENEMSKDLSACIPQTPLQ